MLGALDCALRRRSICLYMVDMASSLAAVCSSVVAAITDATEKQNAVAYPN